MAGTAGDIPREFFEVADTFIDLANKQAETWGIDRVAASHLFSAARFAAFGLAVGDPARLADRANATAMLVEQFQQMLEDNLDWYAAELKGAAPAPEG
jgi:hypothetical protein